MGLSEKGDCPRFNRQLWDAAIPPPGEDLPPTTMLPPRNFFEFRTECRIMTKWRFEQEFEDEAELSPPEPLSRKHRGKMPVGSEAKAKAAAKETWRSRQATKRVARVASGIRNRRNKRID